MRRLQTKNVYYEIHKLIEREWVTWDDGFTTLAAAKKQLAQRYRGEAGDELTYAIVKVTEERIG